MVEVKVLHTVHIYSVVLDPSVMLQLCKFSSLCFCCVVHYISIVWVTQCLNFSAVHFGTIKRASQSSHHYVIQIAFHVIHGTTCGLCLYSTGHALCFNQIPTKYTCQAVTPYYVTLDFLQHISALIEPFDAQNITPHWQLFTSLGLWKMLITEKTNIGPSLK